MHTSHEQSLRVLEALPLREIGLAADLLWMHFGEYRETLDYKGRPREVGEWALHVQTPWNFVRGSRILIGSCDMYYYKTGDSYDSKKGVESRFDHYAFALNQEFRVRPPRVTRVVCDTIGALTLWLGEDLTFSAFPDCASASQDYEFWRLFRPGIEGPHYVVATDSSESDSEE